MRKALLCAVFAAFPSLALAAWEKGGDSLAGRAVISSDGQKLGTVRRSVYSPTDQRSILLETTDHPSKCYAIPEGQFRVSDQGVVLVLRSEQLVVLIEDKRCKN